MIPVVTPERMRAIDAAAPVGVATLVERAGEAVARAAIGVLAGTYGRTVNIVAGPGNNGADGRVAAERLAGRGVKVRVFDVDTCPAVLPVADLVIDAAYGTGFRGRWTPPDHGGVPVLAVDVPSGLHPLTGAAPEATWSAVTTVTFGALKPGLVLGRGPQLAGRIIVAEIGLDVGPQHPADVIGVVEATDVAAWVPRRERTDHKWSHAVRVVAGSVGMTGAARLAAAAAHRAGAGMVTLSTPGGLAGASVEVVERTLAVTDWDTEVLADLDRFHALVVGPGLGRADHTLTCVQRLLTASTKPVVVDGDGLYALTWNSLGHPQWLRDRTDPVILTPHDGEFALLTGGRPTGDRLAAARQLSSLTGAVVVLKGATTVIADPAGPTYLVSTGDERLATAGTGDVLAGVIAAALALGAEPAQAAAAGTWLHAAAGAASPRFGAVASDLIAALPGVLADVYGGPR